MAELEEKEVAATERESDLPIPDILPVLPLKDVVVFPFIILPLSVSREKSINAVDAALAEQRIIMLVAQRDAQNDAPRPEDLYPVGTVAAIMRMLKLPDGRIRLLVQGLSRARLDSTRPRPAMSSRPSTRPCCGASSRIWRSRFPWARAFLRK